jgi:predicted glycogen debranching enzyme
MCATRRYHGLLVATPEGQDKRHLFLARYEEILHGVGRSFPMSIARYAGLWSPHGHDGFVGFERQTHPVFRYRFGQTLVSRQVLLVGGRPISLSRYEMTQPEIELMLELRPLLAFRDVDALTFENLDLSTRIERLGHAAIRLRPYPALPEMVLEASAPDARFEADPVWFRRIEYTADLERGYDGHEDQFSPGRFLIPMREGSVVVVSASIDGQVGDGLAAWAAEADRRPASPPPSRGTRGRLAAAADDFLYRRHDGSLGVLAGFPWFGEWGRDTFVSTPGLTLGRGDPKSCGQILRGALPWLHRGLLPNIFGRTLESSRYNSADAALWFAWAVAQYDAAGAPPGEMLGTFLPALAQIAIAYRDGTELGIAADAQGLLRAGGAGLNATWMDACVDGVPVTPRHGLAVEINALWYSLLAHLVELCERADDAWNADAWRTHRDKVAAAFRQAFWLPDGPYLADVKREGPPDLSIRPNMILAAAIARSPLTPAERLDVVRVVEAELLTPRGLRTLAPDDPAYVGRYGGGPRERDMAYHQGTVWPWLLGSYVEAVLRARGRSAGVVAPLRALLDGFADHLEVAGIGHVSEVFDGDPPHRPGGTIAQAWNVAEMLRAYALLEEV